MIGEHERRLDYWPSERNGRGIRIYRMAYGGDTVCTGSRPWRWGWLVALGLAACGDTVIIRDPCADLRFIETRDVIVRGSKEWEQADKAKMIEEYRDILTLGTGQQIVAHNKWIEIVCPIRGRTD